MRTKVVALCALGLLAVSAVHAEEWKLAKDEDGIKVYLSEVPGSRYKAYRGITTIKADIATLRALQEDVAGSCAWIHECREQKLLKLEGSQSWTYTRFNTPWPVTPRDSVLHVTSQLGADGSVTRILEGVPDYLPEAKGYVRVTQVEGLWKLVPKGAGEVEVTYQLHTEPGGSVPSWLANSFVVDAPFNTLKAMRERAEKR
ncbi:START domain protein [compost metagenome]